MLKKLVKYGNSNALVLDKALLELLNIGEGSVVKIKTDGTSLIITPQDAAAPEALSKTVTQQDALRQVQQQSMATWCGSAEKGQAYLDEIGKVMARYEGVVKKFASAEVQEELKAFGDQVNGDYTDPKYLKAVAALRQKHAPELDQMDAEIKLLSQKYAVEGYRYEDKNNNGAFSASLLGFKRVHGKYQHLFPLLTALQENPDYIHESVVLAEKYQATKNSPEYLKEYAELIARYIPEYAHYQEELKAVAEQLK